MADLLRMQELTLLKLLDEITAEQEDELQEMAQESEKNRLFIERMHPINFRKRVQVLRVFDGSRLEKLLEAEAENTDDPSERRSLLIYSIAATILLVLGSGWWFIHRWGKHETTSLLLATATLRWPADSINLGEMREGVAYKAGTIRIARVQNEFFVMRDSAIAAATTDTLKYRLEVGGKEDIQVFFPDSTKIQVCPSSSLAFTYYPPSALLKEKRLGCDGEVLIEAGHHCQLPLIVETPRQEITVLGTLFEIRDYPAEDTGAVFCYSGKISVRAADNIEVLRASQRLTTQTTSSIKISTGDFPQAQWSSPELFFDFTHVDLQTAMQQIARWYGYTYVIFKDGVKKDIPGMVFSGQISRYLTLNHLLAILERKDLHFSIQEREQTILVSEN